MRELKEVYEERERVKAKVADQKGGIQIPRGYRKQSRLVPAGSKLGRFRLTFIGRKDLACLHLIVSN